MGSNIIGGGYTLTIGFGLNPISNSWMKCTTEVGEVTNDVLPDVPPAPFKVSSSGLLLTNWHQQHVTRRMSGVLNSTPVLGANIALLGGQTKSASTHAL